MLLELLACLLWALEWMIWRMGRKTGPGFRRSRQAKGGYRRTGKPAWVRREVIRMKVLMPDAGCRTIADTFNRRFAGHQKVERRATVGKSFVAETIRKHQYEIEVHRRAIKHRVPPPVPKNLVWAMDLTGKRDTQGNTYSILGLLDHGSCALLRLTALPDKASWTLLGHLFLAIGQYGKPRMLRTDNEAVFVSRLFRTGHRQRGTYPSVK